MMREIPLVSVIIPVYGVEKLLDKCVQSVVSQTYRHLEIFLVDDGSPDNCPQMCDEWAKRDERIKVLHKENGGQGTARNLALDNASGDYISFVDSDDTILPDMLEIMVSAAEEYNTDLAICDYIADNGVNMRTVSRISSAMVFDRDELMYQYIATPNIFTGPCNKLYKSHLFKEIRFPAFRAHEDAYMLPDVLAACEKAVHVGKPLYVQYIRPGSTENSAFSKKNLSIIEVSKHTVEVYALHNPENLYYAELKEVRCYVGLMKKIHSSYSYAKNKKIYCELKAELAEKYDRFIEKYPQAENELRDVNFALNHNLRFPFRCKKDGVVSRTKSLVKKVLSKNK